MKRNLLIATCALLISTNSFAFLNCESNERTKDNKAPLFVVDIVEQREISITVTDNRIVTMNPEDNVVDYTCEKSDEQDLVKYSCKTIGTTNETYMWIFLDKAAMVANYVDQIDGLEYENLNCENY